jgi:hypothetical protein
MFLFDLLKALLFSFVIHMAKGTYYVCGTTLFFVQMSNEKQPQPRKKARVEAVVGSTAPALARLVVDAMTDEGDTKTAMLTQTLSGTRLLEVLPRPVLEHMAQYLDSVIDRRPLLLALGRKGPLGSNPEHVLIKLVEAFRWPTCILDHEWRDTLSTKHHPNDLTALAKWLPTRPQQAVALRTLVLRDVLDLLQKRPHQVRDLFAPLKSHIRHLVLEQTLNTKTITPDALSPSLFCGAALRSIRVQQLGDAFWTLKRFTQWLRTEAPSTMVLERFEWMDATAVLSWTEDVRPLLELWASWPSSRRPTHVGFMLVDLVSRREMDVICSSLPQLKTLRLDAARMNDGPPCLDGLAKLELTDLQLPNIHPERSPSLFDELALAKRMASFRQLQRLYVTTSESQFRSQVDVMDTLAPLVHMRYFRGFATWLPLDPKSWSTIRGLSIVDSRRDDFKEAHAKRLVRFVDDHHGTLHWVDIDIVASERPVQLLTECKSCPWRHVRLWPLDGATPDIQFPITLTTTSMRLYDFKWPADWVERFFPLPNNDDDAPTRGNLRGLVYHGDSLSLSIDQMKRLAGAARHLETVDLSVNVLDIGNGTDVSEWCKYLATWPRQFPRLRTMVVVVNMHPCVPTLAFWAPVGRGPAELPGVHFSFPREGQVADDAPFDTRARPYYFVPTWIEPGEGEKED